MAVGPRLIDQSERPIASRLTCWEGAALAKIYLTDLYKRATLVIRRGFTGEVPGLTEPGPVGPLDALDHARLPVVGATLNAIDLSASESARDRPAWAR